MDRRTKEFIKDNITALAKEHKLKCNGKNCNVQLFSLYLVLKALRIELTEEDEKILC